MPIHYYGNVQQNFLDLFDPNINPWKDRRVLATPEPGYAFFSIVDDERDHAALFDLMNANAGRLGSKDPRYEAVRQEILNLLTLTPAALTKLDSPPFDTADINVTPPTESAWTASVISTTMLLGYEDSPPSILLAEACLPNPPQPGP